MEQDLPPLAAEDHRCDTCSYDFAAHSPAEAAALVGTMPDRYATELSATPAGVLGRRPEVSVWSVLEYACHVRDVYATFTIRLYRTRTEDRPALEPMFNDLRAVRFRYGQLEPGPVLEELRLNVAGFLDEVARVRDWDRTATRRPEETRTARWLVRQAAHEGLHHLADIAAVRASPFS
jgi:hypothetical protein